MDPQRVAVIGPGGVGGFFAAHLAATDHEVTACARRPFDRYVIDSDTAPIEGPATVVTDPADLDGTPFDWVLVGVKAHQSAGATAWFDRTCGPDTTVVALQNGIEAVERLTPLAHGATVIPSVVYCGAELLAPGRLRHRGVARLIVPDNAPGHALADLFDGTAPVIEPSPDHHRSAWVKLSLNVLANGLTALTGQPMEIVGHADLRPVATALLREVTEVAIADGAELELDRVGETVTMLAGHTGGRTSMQQDTEAGRPTEHDAIHGAVRRAAQRHGIATPHLDTVHAILAARSTGFENAASAGS